MIDLTDAELLLRLKDTEHSFVERKSVNDLGDCLKTVVAFANTAPIGFPAILFVGVTDKGDPEDKTADFDQLQRKLSGILAKAYPLIYTLTRILKSGSKEILAVIVPGSDARPHFAGQAYIRDGSKTVTASREQFENLIAQRNGKTYEILKWKDKGITLTQIAREQMLNGSTQWSYEKHMLVNVSDCNLHYVTLSSFTDGSDAISYALSLIELNFDNRKKRLELRLLDGQLPPWPVLD